jgi:alpha-ketoglutarate-dependent taurine dioxygenase
VLAPRVLSATGGQTEFANTYAAFDDLPKEEREYLETLKVVHSMLATMSGATPNPGLEDFRKWLSYPQPIYPLVWKHKSGRKSLVLSKSCSHIVGMHPAESRALLDRLMAHATQAKYVYRHSWRMGDLLIWDNTGTIHRVLPYDENSGRRLHRFTLNGEEALAVEA